MLRLPKTRLRRGLLAALTALTAFTLLPLTATTASAESATAPASFGRTVTAKLDSVIANAMQVADIPGVDVGLWIPGRGSYVRAFGVADKATGAPMRTDTNFRIGSETKTFTATVLLELVDHHRVRLDDPIDKYVPGVPDGGKITVRDLADMRSGLYPYENNKAFEKSLLSMPQQHFTPRQLLAYSFTHPLDFTPGTAWEYSDTNFIVLGLLIQNVTGVDVARAIRCGATDPSGLPHSFLPDLPRDFPSPRAHGYAENNGLQLDTTFWSPSWAWAAGGIVSDLWGLKRWARDVAVGTLLRPATQKQRTDFLPTTIPNLTYGLGLFDYSGWIGHDGIVPGYNTVAVYLPQQHATLVVLDNTDTLYQGTPPAALLAAAITNIVTPGNVYGISP
jgi:D-alanyl-D-alanine carboxypeptidase